MEMLVLELLEITLIKVKNMKIIYYIILILVLIGCGQDKDFDEFNQYGDYTRNNDYGYIGDFSFTMISSNIVSLNDYAGSYTTPLYINNNEFLVPTSNGKIHKIVNEKIVWTYTIENNLKILASIIADKELNSYFVTYDKYFISLDKEGKERFKIKLETNSSPVFLISELLILKNNIYLGTTDGILFKYDNSGKLLWKNKYPKEITSVFCSDENENIYIGLTENDFEGTDEIIKIDKNGKELKRKIFDNLRILSPIIYTKNRIYCSFGKRSNSELTSVIKSIDINLEQKWEYEIPLLVTNLSHNEEHLFVSGISSGMAENMTGLYSFDQQGKLIWKNFLSINISSPLIIGKNHFAFTAHSDKGPAIFIFSNSDGKLIKYHSLSNETIVYLVPVVSDDKDIYLFGSQALIIVKLTKTPLDKLLPYK